MTGVRLRHADGGTRELQCAGLFALVGLEPNSAIEHEEGKRPRWGGRTSNPVKVAWRSCVGSTPTPFRHPLGA